MTRAVRLHLVDPSAVVALAEEVKREFDPDVQEGKSYRYGSWVVPRVLYLVATPDGKLLAKSSLRDTVKMLYLGHATNRRKRGEVALWGVWFDDFWDEVVEGFAHAGVRAVKGVSPTGGGKLSLR